MAREFGQAGAPESAILTSPLLEAVEYREFAPRYIPIPFGVDHLALVAYLSDCNRKDFRGRQMTDPTSLDIIPQLTPEQLQEQARAWLHAPVTRFYTNGFAIAQSNSDVTLIMLLNGAPIAIANMSFISAKSLSDELGKTIKILEESIDQKIPNMNEMAEKLSKARNQSHGNR